jgi:hypothetical protein
MKKEELMELLPDLPDEEYLDKLVEAVKLWSQVKDKLPKEEYLDRIIEAGNVSFEAY